MLGSLETSDILKIPFLPLKKYFLDINFSYFSLNNIQLAMPTTLSLSPNLQALDTFQRVIWRRLAKFTALEATDPKARMKASSVSRALSGQLSESILFGHKYFLF